MEPADILRGLVDHLLEQGQAPHEAFNTLHGLLKSLRKEFCSTRFNDREISLLRQGYRIEAIKAYRERMTQENEDASLAGACSAMNEAIDMLDLNVSKIPMREPSTPSPTGG